MKKIIIFLILVISVSSQTYRNRGISVPLESNGGVPVNSQDQTTPPIEYFLTRTLNSITILDTVLARTNRFVLDSGHNVDTLDLIEIFHQNGVTGFLQLRVVNVIDDTIWTGILVNFDIIPLNIVSAERVSENMAVNASLDNPVRFSLGPKNGLEWDLTRTTLQMICNTAPDDGLFGDIPALTNGIFFGFENSVGIQGYLVNIFINGGFKLTSGGSDVNYAARSGGQGNYGVAIRKSFTGPDKYGVAVRLNGETDDEFVTYIQDTLTGLVGFSQKVMGHETQD